MYISNCIPSFHFNKMPEILDLSPDAVHKSWKKNGVANAVLEMERCEHWVIDKRDGPEEIIRLLCDRLNSTPVEGVAESVKACPSNVIELMGFMHSGRALALFRWLSDNHPEAVSSLFGEASESASDFSVLLLERISVLERMHLLSRVFSPERTAIVIEVLESLGLSNQGSDE